MASNLSPMYIAEVAPAHLARPAGLDEPAHDRDRHPGCADRQLADRRAGARGRHGRDDPALVERPVRLALDVHGGARYPPSLFFLLTLLVPESPRWLAKNGKTRCARAVLARDRRGRRTPSAELARHPAPRSSARRSARSASRDLLEPRRAQDPGRRQSCSPCCSSGAASTSSSTTPRRSSAQAGYGVSDVLFNIVITGASTWSSPSWPSPPSTACGRRPLMLMGCARARASLHCLIGAGLLPAAGQGPARAACLRSLARSRCYAMSLAPVTWVLISEIFPNRIRGAAVSVAVSALWIACFVADLHLPAAERALGPAGTFWLYAASAPLGFVFVWRAVPETKGRSLEEIERRLVGSLLPARGPDWSEYGAPAPAQRKFSTSISSDVHRETRSRGSTPHPGRRPTVAAWTGRSRKSSSSGPTRSRRTES